MSIQRLSFVVPVPDLAAAVEVWRAVLDQDPTFVDGDRWAQFDVQGVRLSLAGTDRVGDEPGIMMKVDDLDETSERLRRAGMDVSEVADGAHERRAVATVPGGWQVIVHAPLP